MGAATAAEAPISAAECFVPAFKAANADAVAACYAEDAILWFPGGPMAKGRAAIRDGFAGYFAHAVVKQATLSPIGEERMGDIRGLGHVCDYPDGQGHEGRVGRERAIHRHPGADRWEVAVHRRPPIGRSCPQGEVTFRAIVSLRAGRWASVLFLALRLLQSL
ncbi:YybH family protein [Thermomonas sp.]